ncbi:DUF1456 family protein [Aliamphritea ceti]|uniref:DUF1456 family protein n=1 Tax=Aliamphritea ceti TaxID=1524258 RepID=UPI0021C371E7|nr:DUF1456 family protein [Aliamphritea ceti]
MTNNDVLRRVRYIFNIDDNGMIGVFAAADVSVSRSQVSDWLKKDDDADFQLCEDSLLATFLNGFINEKRGKREGPQVAPESSLSHNIVFMKLKIALNLQAEDVLEILAMGGSDISKHELSAFFRKPGHKHYRECKTQILRNFLKGLQLKYRPE